MTKYLFVYGTLAPGREPEVLRPHLARLSLVGPASVTGSLYDLGPYPGAIFQGSGRVFGQVFEVPDDETLWAALDAYEGFDPASPGVGLFRREACVSRLDFGGDVACEIYVYNGKPPEGARIFQGRWRAPVTP